MSDSGRQMGDCKHARIPKFCDECREEASKAMEPCPRCGKHTFCICEAKPPITDQPPPLPAEGDVWLDVIADMQDRRKLGIERYGVPLQVENGRNALVDKYLEQLDDIVYTRQAIEQRWRMEAELEELRETVKTLRDERSRLLAVNDEFAERQRDLRSKITELQALNVSLTERKAECP